MSFYASKLSLYWRTWWVLGFSCLIYGVLWGDFAFAQGAITTDESFHCVGSTASGQLFSLSNNCQSVIGGAGNPIDLKHLFSFLVCNIETLTTALFGNLYCGVIQSLSPAIYAATTLAVLFFGVSFTIGLVDFTAKELLTFLLRIALFIAFTTEADYMIGVAFRFFITGAQEGIAIAISALFTHEPGNSQVSGQDLYYFIDNFFYQFISQTTASVGITPASGRDPCDNAIFAALGLLAIAFPPIFYIGIMILAKIAMTFVRGVFGYMFSIVALAFLMVLSPIYLTFGLFKQTRPWFDKYIGYLASFSLQMIFVFTFLAFILSLPLSHVPNSIFSIIVFQETTYETDKFRWPWQYCTLCDYDVYDINGTPEEPNDDIKQPEGTKINPAIHRLQCKTPLTALEPLALFSPQPDGSGENPVTQNQKLQSVLLDFAMYGLLGLLVLVLIIDQVLSFIPYLAQSLGSGLGGSFTPQVAGGPALTGKATVSLPFESSFSAAADGFTRGFARGSPALGGAPGDSITATAAGITEASQAVLLGSGRDPGLVGGMVEWLVNPQRGTQKPD